MIITLQNGVKVNKGYAVTAERYDKGIMTPVFMTVNGEPSFAPKEAFISTFEDDAKTVIKWFKDTQQNRRYTWKVTPFERLVE